MKAPRELLRLVAALLLCPGLAAQEPRLFRGGLPIQLEESPASDIVVHDFDVDGRDDAAIATVTGGASVITGLVLPLGTVETELAGGAKVVAAGDIDPGGDLELLTASGRDLTLWRRGAGGAWSGITTTVGDFPSVPTSIALADIDRDGDLDAVLATSNSDLLALRHDPDGGFVAWKPALPAPSTNIAPACADFDGDGAADLLVVGWLSVELRKGRGDGTFLAAESISLPGPGVLLEAADFRADGKADAVVVLEDGTVLLVDDLGALDAEPVFDLPDLTPLLFQRASLHVTDFDGSGTDDLLVVDPSADVRGLRALLGTGDGSFAVELGVQVGFEVRRVASGDFDGDGLGDLIIPRADQPALVVLPGEAPGAHALAAVTLLPLRGRHLGVVDVQPDGAPDLLVTSLTGCQTLLGDGAAGFQPTRSLDLPDVLLAHGVEGDFDGDGRTDIAAADQDGGRLLILNVDRTGGIAIATAHALECLPSRLAAADFDGDGWLDIAATCRGKEDMVLVLHPADPQATRRQLRAGPTPTALAAGDLDGDARPDLAVATAENGVVLLAEGPLSFRRALEIPELALARSLYLADADASGDLDLLGLVSEGLAMATSPLRGGARVERRDSARSLRALEIADIAGDGLPELLLVAQGELRWVEGGAADLEPRERYAIGALGFELRLVDLDLDGRRDLVVLEADGRELRVLRASHASPVAVFQRGDVDGSGRLDITDAVAIADSLFRGAGSLGCPDAADADDDGYIVITDVIRLLLYQFQGGPPPPTPRPGSCGIDPTPDRLEACARGCGGAR